MEMESTENSAEKKSEGYSTEKEETSSEQRVP
jgi:hypothetical protein